MDPTYQAAAKLIGKLIGLARATDGNEHLINPGATAVILESLAATLPGPHREDAVLEQLCAAVEEEKRKMVPDCFLCANPCGKNADFDLRQLEHDDEEIRRLKLLLLSGIRSLAADARHAASLGRREARVEQFLYQGLIVIGMDGWDADRLLGFLQELSKVNLLCMAMLRQTE